MANLLTPFPIRLFPATCSTTESPTKVDSFCHLSDRRTVYFEDKKGRQRELVFDGSARLGKIYSGFRKRSVVAKALSCSIPVDKTEKELSKYLFWTENGNQVKVVVDKKSMKYTIIIEFLSVEGNMNLEKLVLSWGIYRSDSSSFIPLEDQETAPHSANTISEFPIIQNSFGTYVVEMEFESHLAPFYLSFVLKHPSADDERPDIKSHHGARFVVPVGFGSGDPAPLGHSFSSDGKLNFAVFSRNAGSVVLCLYDDNTTDNPALEIELDPFVNRTGDIWHASFNNPGPFLSYGYRCKGATANRSGHRVLLDPYAKSLRKKVFGHPDLGELHSKHVFDWSGDFRPGIPMEKLVVYRLNVSHFTGDKSSKVPAHICGTFAGITEKVQHFTKLGINAILLEPIFPCSVKEGPYFPFHFFSPVQTYGPAGDSVSATCSMKEMVKKMHASGIEVILEVVFTHTSEGAFQEIDYLSYSYAAGDADLDARNALNCNYPIAHQLIVDSLRYWVTEFHVDGFCFVNSSYLLKGSYGEPLSRPPLIEAITFDPILSKTKLVADSWDPCDLTSKEISFPHWRRWAEINSRFSVDVRNFIRGEGLLSQLATRLCGSGDIFSAGRGPAFSFNYVARNSGLTLVDLVSFSSTELASELSWNCGEEGPTDKKIVLEKRLKQVRNFLFILFVSLGVPVLNMGDECGQSSGGSPEYSDRKPFNWSALNTAFGAQVTQFISFLSSLRVRRSDLLQKREFLKEENIDWYDTDLSPPKWDDATAKFMAMLLKVDRESLSTSSESSYAGDLYVAFNAGENSESIMLPSIPEGMVWVGLIDTGLPSPGFFTSEGIPIPDQISGTSLYEMNSYSCALFEARVQQS